MGNTKRAGVPAINNQDFLEWPMIKFFLDAKSVNPTEIRATRKAP
jgi:hypothetical protein